MQIDFHTHIFPDHLAEHALRTLCAKAGPGVEPVSGGTMGELLAEMSTSQVDYAVICNIATKPAQFAAILKFCTDLQDGVFGSDAATHLIPFASVHPDDEVRFLHLKQIAEKGLKGIKLHPYYQRCVLDTPEILEYLRCCRDLDLIVQCHCGFDIGFPLDPLCGPERIARVIAEIPGIKFVAAHLGGWKQWGGAIEHLLGKDIYLDTAVTRDQLHTATALRMLREHAPEYLLFGTDWPWLSLKEGVDFVAGSSLDQSAITAIMGNNAARLLGMD